MRYDMSHFRWADEGLASAFRYLDSEGYQLDDSEDKQARPMTLPLFDSAHAEAVDDGLERRLDSLRTALTEGLQCEAFVWALSAMRESWWLTSCLSTLTSKLRLTLHPSQSKRGRKLFA